MPISASWASGRFFSVQVRSSEPSNAAPTAAICVVQPAMSKPTVCAAITPSPATCAMARSMKTMPRFRTCWPSGTCESSTRVPAIIAGQRMLRYVEMLFIALP